MCKEHEKRGLCLPVTLLGCNNNGLTTRKRIVAQQRVTTAAQDRFVGLEERLYSSVWPHCDRFALYTTSTVHSHGISRVKQE